jgi:hypothetical protein
VWFHCHACRSTLVHNQRTRVELTGRKRPYRNRGAMGTRSCHTSREYRCECGHVGWSNHIDLARRELGDVGFEALRA